MGDTYSTKAALQWERLIEKLVQMLLRMIDDNLEQAVDMLHWNRLMIADMASGIFWGKSFGAMEGADPPELVTCLNGSFLSWSLRYHAPLLHKLLKSLPIPALHYLFNIDQFLSKVSDSTDGLLIVTRLMHMIVISPGRSLTDMNLGLIYKSRVLRKDEVTYVSDDEFGSREGREILA